MRHASGIYARAAQLPVHNRCPHYLINGDHVSVLETPSQFLVNLKALIARSSKRIVIAALYLGTDEPETCLVDTIKEALERSQVHSAQ